MILVCAATRTEAAACRAGLADAAAEGFEVLVTGVGPERAARALRARLAAGGVELVVSSGFAGALTPGIEPLAWVTADAVYRLSAGRAERVAVPPGMLRVLDGAVACAVVTASEVVGAAPEGVGAPVAADMESAALAEVAAAAGVALAVLRLVTDAPARPMAAVGRRLADALAAPGLAACAADGLRAALEAARAPRSTAAFLRDTSRWRAALRAGWCERGLRGVSLA